MTYRTTLVICSEGPMGEEYLESDFIFDLEDLRLVVDYPDTPLLEIHLRGLGAFDIYEDVEDLYVAWQRQKKVPAHPLYVEN